jgi:hypothetical protein
MYDKATVAYLPRCASRWREDVEGFDSRCKRDLLHFVWVKAFDGFFVPELNSTVEAPSVDSVIVFDCWKPDAAGDEAGFERTLVLVAQRIWERGKKPWGFRTANRATSGLPSVQDLENAGFQPRYSLIRQLAVGVQAIKGKTPRLDPTVAGEVSART